MILTDVQLQDSVDARQRVNEEFHLQPSMHSQNTTLDHVTPAQSPKEKRNSTRTLMKSGVNLNFVILSIHDISIVPNPL